MPDSLKPDVQGLVDILNAKLGVTQYLVDPDGMKLILTFTAATGRVTFKNAGADVSLPYKRM